MKRDDAISAVKGVGPKSAQRLGRLGIYTVSDMLSYYPRDYVSYGEPVSLADRSFDNRIDTAYIVTLNSGATHFRRGSRDILSVSVPAGQGSVRIVWYNSPFLKSRLIRGRTFILYGRVVDKGRGRVLEHPEIFDPEKYDLIEGSLQPVYPLTAGLSQNFMKKTMGILLDSVEPCEDHLPIGIRKKYELSELEDALQQIHFPVSFQAYRKARRRLAFDEFFVFTLSLGYMKTMAEDKGSDFRVNDDVWADDILAALPYRLTAAQMRCFMDVDRDLRSGRVMNRLIQGDVGSGKTIVAALALYEMAKSGYQSCLMVPTEVLARQHYENLSSLFDGRGVRTELLTGSMTLSQKREAYEKIADHEADIIIGTHAVFQDKVIYDRLGLIVTDEQHRFGVLQRERISKKSGESEAHVLVMSATPIPRTLALVLYSDLDVSVIDEKPVGRLPIKNCVVDTSYRNAAYRLMAQQIKEGKQVYVICPLVEESEGLEAENVQDYAKNLRGIFGDEISVEYLHGRMKDVEKNRIMKDFSDGRIDILVSTTVIEVGVDVPSATVMMIENSERFGLAQLHQLRGRVGRGKDQSYCIFMYGSGYDGKSERLEIMEKTNDGFEIAAQDMKLRGPGDMLGIRQSGEMLFNIADIYEDSEVLMEASKASGALLKADPGLTSPENRLLKDMISENNQIL